MNRHEQIITASGHISATVRLGGTGDEYGYDINYSSWFTAHFLLHFNEEDAPDTLELEKLEMEQTNWFEDNQEEYDFPDEHPTYPEPNSC